MAKENGSKTLDLHGFQSGEVFDAVERFITQENGKGSKRARIMTGKGKGIVQKVVADYLEKSGYPWRFETGDSGQPNSGVMIVFLD